MRIVWAGLVGWLLLILAVALLILAGDRLNGLALLSWCCGVAGAALTARGRAVCLRR